MSAWKHTEHTYYSDSVGGLTTVGDYHFSRMLVEHHIGSWYGGLFYAIDHRGSEDRPMPAYDLIDDHWLYSLYGWKRFETEDEALAWCEWMDQEMEGKLW